jgi:hypothetical protein
MDNGIFVCVLGWRGGMAWRGRMVWETQLRDYSRAKSYNLTVWVWYGCWIPEQMDTGCFKIMYNTVSNSK